MSKAGAWTWCSQKILSVAKSTGSLILATVASCITMALTTGNSYLSILIPGEMFRDAYRERGLAAKNLSRTLEDAGTVFVPPGALVCRRCVHDRLPGRGDPGLSALGHPLLHRIYFRHHLWLYWLWYCQTE